MFRTQRLRALFVLFIGFQLAGVTYSFWRLPFDFAANSFFYLRTPGPGFDPKNEMQIKSHIEYAFLDYLSREYNNRCKDRPYVQHRGVPFCFPSGLDEELRRSAIDLFKVEVDQLFRSYNYQVATHFFENGTIGFLSWVAVLLIVNLASWISRGEKTISN